MWIFRTAIPNDAEGTVWGSLEWNADGGSIKGTTSQLATTQDFGEFEYGLSSYSLWDGFTYDGSSMINCLDPT